MEITELPTAVELGGDEVLPVVQGGETKKASVKKVRGVVPDSIELEDGVLQLTADGEKVGDGVTLPKPTIDSKLNPKSDNAVSNKAVAEGLKEVEDKIPAVDKELSPESQNAISNAAAAAAIEKTEKKIPNVDTKLSSESNNPIANSAATREMLKIENALLKNVVSGKSLTIDDAADFEVPSFKIFGNSTQDGEPSMDNPIPVICVGEKGNIKITVCEKNLFDIPNVAVGKHDYTIKCNIAEPITISGLYNTVVSSQVWRICVTHRSGYKVYVLDKECLKGRLFSKKFDADETDPIVSIVFRCVYMTDGSIDNIMVAFGDEMEYEPYTGVTRTIVLPEPLRAVSDKIYDSVNWASGTITRNVGVYEMTGEEVFFGTGIVKESNPRVIRSYFAIPNSTMLGGTALDGFCTHAPDVKRWLTESNIDSIINSGGIYYGVHFAQMNNLIYFYSGFENTGELKAYFQSQYDAGTPVTIYYPLAEPKIEHIEPILLRTYQAVLNSYNDENAAMECTYVADPKKYIDKKFNELSTAIVALGGVNNV